MSYYLRPPKGLGADASIFYANGKLFLRVPAPHWETVGRYVVGVLNKAESPTRCAHSVCSQNFIDTGDTTCVVCTCEHPYTSGSPECSNCGKVIELS